MKTVLFNTLLTQSLGLMFKRPKNNTLYVFDFKKSVKISFHMFFVPSAIDLYLLNNKREIVEMRKNFRPFQIHYPQHDFYYAIETKPDLLTLKQGDVLKWPEH